MRVLINRNGAYGDILHISHLPRMFKENGYDYVGVSTGYKGYQLLKSNPFIDNIHFFEPGDRSISEVYYDGRINVLSQLYDKTVNLICSLEENVLSMESQTDYYQDIGIRKKRGEKNYYDVATELAGFPQLLGKYRGEVFYSDEEVRIVENDLLREGRFRDKFKVLINLAGSGPHKVFIQAEEVANRITKEFPDAVIFTTGCDLVKELDFKGEGDRIRSVVGKKPFRQVLLMAKYMDCVIGCESGLMVGASMWDVPTIQLLTATSKYCHCKYSTKDYSIQSPARCSPCYKGPYKYYGCPKKGRLPICVYFNVEDILHNVRKIYEEQYLLSRGSKKGLPELSTV